MSAWESWSLDKRWLMTVIALLFLVLVAYLGAGLLAGHVIVRIPSAHR